MAVTTSPLLLLLAVTTLLSAASAANYTVVWKYDSTSNASAANYTAWAASHAFHVGDFLIFNADSNSSVIQTYNETTYDLCSIDQDYGNLTSQLGMEDVEVRRGDGIPVVLEREGVNFYFSNADGGEQCRKGMRFRIEVGERRIPPPPPPDQMGMGKVDRNTGEESGTGRWGIAFGVVVWLVL